MIVIDTSVYIAGLILTVFLLASILKEKSDDALAGMFILCLFCWWLVLPMCLMVLLFLGLFGSVRFVVRLGRK